MEHFLVYDPDPFISPVSSSNTPPTVHTTDTADITLHDDNDNDATLETCSSLNQPHKHGLTKEEFDCVVNSLLEYLEEAEIASPESGCEEYEYHSPENAKRKLHPWAVVRSILLHWVVFFFFGCSPPKPLGRQGHPCTSRTAAVRTKETLVELGLWKWTRRMTGPPLSWCALRAAFAFMQGW